MCFAFALSDALHFLLEICFGVECVEGVVFFELGDDLFDTVLWPHFVVHILFDPVEPDEVETIVFALIHYIYNGNNNEPYIK